MNRIRKAAVAGMFYPESANELKLMVQSLLDKAENDKRYENICGIISPHAGYPYSGLSAAHAYNALKTSSFETAVILSPSHREYFQGLSVFSGDAYETPLGQIEINKELQNRLLETGEYFIEGIKGHGAEHAVEVQLPFLQSITSECRIIPIVIGDQRQIFLDKLTEGLHSIIDDKTVIVVSSDLSHFHTKEMANNYDSIVESHILSMDSEGLQNDLEASRCEACGGGGIVSLLQFAKQKDYKCADILLRNDSGDFSGDNSSVVGYLSAVIYN